MFERRLKVILVIPLFFGLVIVARLYDLQVTHGDEYLRKADAALISPKQFLPPLRGRILDRFGRVLVSDEPAHDVTVHYGVLSLDESYLLLLADRLKRESHAWSKSSDAELAEEVRRRIGRAWTTLASMSGESIGQFIRRRDAHCRSVERLRRYIYNNRRRQGRTKSYAKLRLREEYSFHPILRDVSPEVRARIEVELANMPFIRIEPSVRRKWRDGARPLCHVLGRLGEISPEAIRADPDKDNWLACYRAGDLVGTSGIERVGESMLRGKRGFEERSLDGDLLEHASPIDGLDVQLTIDLDLQQHVASFLAETVQAHPSATGASCVVIDVESREILALVSVPTYDHDAYRRDYARLRDDSATRPLLFRAVSEEYQPGSIMKPISLAAGFSYNLVDPGKRYYCNGEYIPGSSKWHCWTFWRGMPGHGYVNAEEAIQHSCNVYFYGLGERINAARLTTFFQTFFRGPERFGPDSLGPDHLGFKRRGTGLIEERAGLIPSQEWMREKLKRRFRKADGRNYAIGQGEIQITPLQAANSFATLATGHYRDPTLIANDCLLRERTPIAGVSTGAWALIRRGLYRCVNEPGGTAYNHVRMSNLEICGKTGSAQCVSRVTAYRYTFENSEGVSQTILAPTPEAARETLGLDPSARWVKREIAERWPPPDPESGKISTHAWFAGFAPYHNPRIALAVVVEHGGSGGRTAGPVAKAIFEEILISPREYLGSASLSYVSEEQP